MSSRKRFVDPVLKDIRHRYHYHALGGFQAIDGIFISSISFE